MPRLRSSSLTKIHEHFAHIARTPFQIACDHLSDYACRYGPSHWLAIGRLEEMRELLLNLSWLLYRSLLFDGWPREVCQAWRLFDEDPMASLARVLNTRARDDAEVFAWECTAVADVIEGLGDPFKACKILQHVLIDLEAQDVRLDVRIELYSRLEELQLQADLSHARLETTGALLALIEAEMEADEKQLLVAQISHVSALCGGGYVEAARQLSEAAWERAQDLYADDLEMRMACLVDHADILLFAEQQEAAAELYRAAVKTLEATLGPGAEEVRFALTGLAQCCDPMSTDDVAILRDVLERTITELGPDDDQVATACDELASRLMHDEPEEALELARQAEAISSNNWGPNHPRTLNGVDRQGEILLAHDKPKEALERFETVFEARKRRLGEDNPALKTSHDNLSRALRELERFDEAIDHAERALALDTWQQGEGHRDRVFALGPLLSLYELAGVPDKADALFDEARALLKGEDRVTLARTLSFYQDYGLEWAEIREDDALLRHIGQVGLEVAKASEDVVGMATFAVALSWAMLYDEGPKAVRALWAGLVDHIMSLGPSGDQLFNTLDSLLDVMDEALPKDKALGKAARALMDAWTIALHNNAADVGVYAEVLGVYGKRLKRHRA